MAVGWQQKEYLAVTHGVEVVTIQCLKKRINNRHYEEE